MPLICKSASDTVRIRLPLPLSSAKQNSLLAQRLQVSRGELMLLETQWKFSPQVHQNGYEVKSLV
jgi:hypothetical protein